ncbi:LemA family protein, partial [Candidatus Marinamargulisbacteria bacterium SCGC AG-439-L15]
KIAEARSKLAGARSSSQRIQASNQLESALSRLLVVVERYPNLKADKAFTRLMDELSGTENRLSVERRRYNENVKLYNRTIRKFPHRWVAANAGFDKQAYFQVNEAAKQAPKVQF